jgi:lipopolysaccharide/colanic/teichoic acid biosynthesis glycosyltransferase
MFKRLFDIIFSFLALIFLSPILCFVSLLIAINLGRPVLFRQTRPGLHGKPFKMLKFRSMLNSEDKNGLPLPDKQRLTPFGLRLRASSLDELPSFFSVLTGDMSLVGPRPLLMQYLPLYNEHQAMRHNVRPGITGWAQVNGRNAISWEDKFDLDVWYVKNRTIWLDIKILLLTIKKVFIKEGISAEGEVTMSAFQGNKEVNKNE